MASLRDSRGRFVKAAAAAAAPTPSPSPLPSFEHIAMEQQQILERLVAQYEGAARENEQRMQAAADKYEQLMQSASASLQELLSIQAAQSPSGAVGTPPPTIPPPAPPAPPAPKAPAPAAQWIKAPDGENFLLLNQDGAVMFLAIFERMGAVFQDLQKPAPKRPGR